MTGMLNLLGVPVPDRLRVAYWGEDPADEIERRVAAILLHFKIPREKTEGWLFVDSFHNQPLRVASLEKGEVVFPAAYALTKALIESRIDGMNCAMPCAPAGLIVLGGKLLSCHISRVRNATGRL